MEIAKCRNNKGHEDGKCIICPLLCAMRSTWKTTGPSEMSKKAIKPDSKIEKSKKRSDAACEVHQIPITLLACKNSAITLLPKPHLLFPGEKKRLSTSRYDFGVSCIIKRKPSEDRALSPQRGSRSSVLRGFSFYNAGHPKTVPRSRKSLLFLIVFLKLASSRLAS